MLLQNPEEIDVEPLFKAVDCISVRVNDLSEAIGFYADKLGQKVLWKARTSAGLGFGNGNSELSLFLFKEQT